MRNVCLPLCERNSGPESGITSQLNRSVTSASRNSSYCEHATHEDAARLSNGCNKLEERRKRMHSQLCNNGCHAGVA